MSDLYEKEAKDEIAKVRWDDTEAFSEEVLARLPAPVQKHLRVCGWAGRKAPKNARVTWSDFGLKRGKDKPFMPFACRQHNSVQEPMRLSFMAGRIARIIPFEGRDKYQGGRGHMLIKAGGLFNVVDETSPKLDRSGLVTVLAETFLVPSYALQPYIRWEAVDSTRAEATLTWNGASVSGVFTFAPSGEFMRFSSKDRWQSSRDSAAVPWTAHAADYIEKDGLRFATGLSAVWHQQDGDFEYVRGRIERIDYDVREP